MSYFDQNWLKLKKTRVWENNDFSMMAQPYKLILTSPEISFQGLSINV